MTEATAKHLISQYNSGRLMAAEEVLLEQYIEAGLIDLEALEDLRQIDQALDVVLNQAPEVRIHEQFKAMLREEQEQLSQPKVDWSGWWNRLFGQSVGLRWAYSLALLILGFGGATHLRSPDTDNSGQMQAMADQVNELQEMIMLTMLEKESVSDRLQAVSLTKDLSDINEKVTSALFKTLNSDKNVNVRLTCLEALYPYADSPRVREGLIQSIQQQHDPLVQMALAELMVSLQEKRSVDAFKKLLDKEELIEEARAKIEESVEVLL
ncbi:MAG: HEAT repeat domain-containing protein [Bacteroidota bacterium]